MQSVPRDEKRLEHGSIFIPALNRTRKDNEPFVFFHLHPVCDLMVADSPVKICCWPPVVGFFPSELDGLPRTHRQQPDVDTAVARVPARPPETR